MPTTYRTPGVFVEEISIFPPSVAEVETAIPAFIGYTEKAIRTSDNKPLTLVPTKIYSLKEYEQYFGGPHPAPLKMKVKESPPGVFQTEQFDPPDLKYILYHCMQLFFANGGGQCYVVSVGGYKKQPEISPAEIGAGLEKLELEDEPTLIVIPEAVKFATEAEYTTTVQNVLLQCSKLGDRFGIFDIRLGDPKITLGEVKAERIRFGNNSDQLKYAAAYYPFIKTTLNYVVVESAAEQNPTGGSSGDQPTSNVEVTYNTKSASAEAADTVKAIDATLSATGTTIGNDGVVSTDGSWKTAKPANWDELAKEAETTAEKAETTAQKAEDAAKDVTKKKEDIKELEKNLQDAQEDQNALPTNASDEEKETANSKVTAAESKLSSAKKDLGDLEQAAGNNAKAAAEAATAALAAANALADAIQLINEAAESAATAASKAVLEAGETVAAAKALSSSTSVDATGGTNVLDLAALKAEKTGLYNYVKAVLKEQFINLPPSAAIAGVYAATDSNRGVWKAPANVSLAGVIEPVVRLDDQKQGELNMDIEGGKSINVIRQFGGKGTLVWGARTLAGNSNEWRYINVRRFFNMVEESVKKSTFWAVFEPNDANTWVKVRGMIENYLVQKWREGALAGATPKEAFFVRCALGSTMMPIDILEGSMIVEIGMAVVRPAEFIILRFSHKLQTS